MGRQRELFTAYAGARRECRAYTSSDQSSTAGNIIDFANTNHAGKVLDNISDGSIYARTIASRVSSGKPWIDFSESIHANKTMQYIGDGGGRYAAGESGANVTSAHVLTATATPSANLPLTGSYVAIPSLGWALIAGSTLDVYNVWTHIQINPPIAGENHSYLIRLALCVDGNTSSPIYSSTYNGLVTSNANSFDLYLFASAVGLSPRLPHTAAIRSQRFSRPQLQPTDGRNLRDLSAHFLGVLSMVTFTLTAPAIVGSLGNQVTIAALQITGFWWTTTPALAQIGTGEMEITLTETTNGWQETISYQDATVLTFMAQATANGAVMGDALNAAIFAKLIADQKIPAGTLSTTPTDPTTPPAQ